MKPSVKDFSREELEQWFIAKGEPRFRGGQLYSWLYGKTAASFSVMSNIKQSLRAVLEDEFDLDEPVIEKTLESIDGTRKLLVRLRDGLAVECVLIPDEKRTTLCISSQVGCKRGCRLCATACMGLKRNLTSGEILNQIIAAKRKLSADERITNIVFMGMGEPMDNLDEVLKALKTVHSEEGLCISPKRVMISTVGVIEGIERLKREGNGVGLAISLHASTDEIRRNLIPLAHKVEMKSLLQAAADYGRAIGEKITFEYVMIKGVNSSPEDGKRLVDL
ncbi:MAG: 23S rRNA (adenine(2503)-C(2))-methyltransferase RlmN, partial [Fibrobacteres bacterium]|nr:23S rRNA (adenine(2503)-C(2))-methyltransferase RlmN [Fibrobacterota bacterium]